MKRFERFVDIHCHLTPGIDDGARTWDETLAMAQMAVDDGIGEIIVTPHQLGAYGHNTGEVIREKASQLQQFLDEHEVGLQVLPGGDVRIEDGMIGKLRTGKVMSLGDHRKHVLLELPHELYFPLEPVLAQLENIGMVGVLSHPERNQGLMKHPELLGPLVDKGCLMQVTAGSLMGTFGPRSQKISEDMLHQGLVHFLATDAHSPKSRRPLLRRAFERTAEFIGEDAARELCCDNPAAVASGEEVRSGRRRGAAKRSRSWWFGWSRAA